MMNIKESNIGSMSSKNISHDKNQIITEINQIKLDDKPPKKNKILSVSGQNPSSDLVDLKNYDIFLDKEYQNYMMVN